jgi:hypothetical protein
MKKEDKALKVQDGELAPIYDEANTLIARAIDQNLPVETIEKLLAMRRELKAEKAKEEYDKAMATFQGECPIIERVKQGYNYKYAPIEIIAEQIKPILLKNGLSYTFNTEEIENKIIVYCTVTHIAGHTGEPSKAIITKETTTKMNSSQQSGAVMTYGKRYSLMNALAIMVRDEDSDAATHQDLGQTPLKSNSVAISSPSNEDNGYSSGTGRITYKQSNFIRGLLKQKGYTEIQLCTKYNVDNIGQLTSKTASAIIENMTKLPDKQQETDEDIIDVDEIDKGIEEERQKKMEV